MGGRDRRWVGMALGWALFGGLMLRVWFVVRHAYIAGDTLVYGDLARNWLEHGVYGFTNTVNGVVTASRPTLIRLPGYPLFLLACFRLFGVGNYSAVMWVQVAVDLWTCLLLGGVARRLWGERAGLAAAWLGALCPFTANYTAAPLTEVLTLWCMATAFYALVRWGCGTMRIDRWALLLGGALAYAILLRPEQGLLAAAVAPAMAWMIWRGRSKLPKGLKPPFSGREERAKSEAYPEAGRSLLPVGVVCLLTVLPLGPWAWRNWRTFHVVEALAPRQANDPGEAVPYGFQRWYRSWAVEFASTDDVYWNYDGARIELADLPDRAFDSPAQYAATETLLNDYDENTTATAALDARFAELARERVEASRLRYYVALPVARVVDMALRPRGEMLAMPLEWWKFHEHPEKTLAAGAYAGLNLGYFVLAFVGLVNPHLRREMWATRVGPIVWVMMGTVVLRCLLLLTLDNSEMRYTLEFFPVLVVLGAGVWSSPREAAGWSAGASAPAGILAAPE